MEPQKLYYSIGEVSRLTDLPASVLRFWETEFPKLRPPKNRAGKRLYRKQDIDQIFLIKQLLYEDRFTIAGARQALHSQPEKSEPPVEAAPRLKTNGGLSAEEIRQSLREILELLSS